MVISVDNMKQALRNMLPEQRSEIREFLLDDPEMTDDEDLEVDYETAAELRRRFAPIERGEVKGIPAHEFLAELEAEFP